jgi:hypothetical protein
MRKNSLERLAAGSIAEGRTRPLDDNAAAAVLGGLMAGEKYELTFVAWTFGPDGQMWPNYVPDPVSEAPVAPAQG